MTKSAIELLDQERKRHKALSDRRTRVEVQLEADRRNLEEAKAEARRLFGTDDLAELRELYKRAVADNEQKVMQFAMELDQVETDLKDIERQVAAV